jgi:hypothetical protein
MNATSNRIYGIGAMLARDPSAFVILDFSYLGEKASAENKIEVADRCYDAKALSKSHRQIRSVSRSRSEECALQFYRISVENT